MASGKRRIGAELAMVALIMASLGGTMHLVISVHRRVLTARQAVEPPAPSPIAATAVPVAPEPPPVPAPSENVEAPPRVVEKPRPAPSPPPEDPTPKALAQLHEATAREAEEAARLDREVRSLEQGRQAAVAESERWRRREMLVQQQVAALAKKAEKLDRQVDAYAAQRDVLARERDALKAALANAPSEGSYAVLPYRGENGTWRRPIVIECTAGSVQIRPDGPSFSLLDLSGLVNPRSSPVVVAIARELLKVQSSASPDGAPVVPYFVFLVRPDGIRSYYEARGRLEPLGIAFGYELIDRDLKVDVPNFDDLATWDGSPSTGVPPASVVQGLPGAGNGAGEGAAAGRGGGPVAGGGLAWPGGGTGDERQAIAGAFDAGRGRGGSQPEGAAGDSPDEFVWPTSRPGLGAPGAPFGDGEGDDKGDGQETGGPGSFGTGRAVRGLPPARLAPAGTDTGDARGGQAMGSGLGAALERLPDFEGAGPGAGDGPGAKPDAGKLAGQGLGAGDDSMGGAVKPSRPAGFAGGSDPASAPAPAPAVGLTVPGRSWRSDGSRRPPVGSAVDVQPALTEATSPAPSGETGGLMWGGSGPASRTPGSATAGVGIEAGDVPPSGLARAPGAVGAQLPGGLARALAQAAGGDASKLAALGSGLRSASSSTAASSSGIGSPGLMLGADPDSGGSGSPVGSGSPGGSGSSAGSPGSQEAGMEPLIKGPDAKRPPAIEVPFEIVVACGVDGVTIQPGGYRITAQALKSRKDEKLLVRNLAAVAQKRAEVDPAIRPRPRVKFLVENDGASTFWEARRQVLFSELSWPMTLQVAGAQNPRLLERGVW